MKPMRDCIERTLHWRQPSALQQRHELRDGEVEVATLEFRNAFGTLATAQTAEGVWTFKRVGVFNARVTVRAGDSERDLAAFRPNTWKAGGTLELADGRQFRADTNLWMTRYSFASPDEQPLVSFQRIAGVLHHSAEVTVHESARTLPELPWIVPLGWYLALLMQHDGGVAAAS